jgi:catechol 2,3-dioxygenase-like lactoylglutathione lyase family enzyme
MGPGGVLIPYPSREVQVMNAVSHVAIGVRDMERSLHFYRDLLGLEVMSDQTQSLGDMPTLYAKPDAGKRRAVNLRYGTGAGRGFLVLSERPGGTPGEAIKLDEVGISHFSWWVDNLRAIHDKLKAAGVKVLVAPSEVDPAGFGETSSHKYLTCLFEDPDGIILQLDQRA